MKYVIKKSTFLILILLSAFFSHNVLAQENQEYRAEIGIQAGGNIYTGEVNSIGNKSLFLKNFKNTQPHFGALLRYKFNSRTALRLGYDYVGVKGNYVYAINTSAQNITLNNTGISQVDLWGEYNFFEYESNQFKRYSKTYTPYIFAGIGYMSMPNSQTERKSAVTIPFGLGLKVKMGKRWNLNVQWANHLLLSDNLEGLQDFDNQAPTTQSNLLNNDLFTGLTLGLSFDFWEKDCDCLGTKNVSSRKNRNAKPLNNSRPRK